MLRQLLNWFRKLFHRPVKFDLDAALVDAQAEAEKELERLGEDLRALIEVDTWSEYSDPITDGLCLDDFEDEETT